MLSTQLLGSETGSVIVQSYKFSLYKRDTYPQQLVTPNRLLYYLNEVFVFSCKPLTTSTHPWILIGGHSHELSLWENEGVKGPLSQAIRTVILRWNNMNTRLVLVHRVQYNLQCLKQT